MSKKPNDNGKSKMDEKKTQQGNKGKSRGKGKSGKPKTFEKPKMPDEPVEESTTKQGANINDSSFYYPNAEVAEQIQSYSFNQFASVESNLGFSNDNEDWKFTLPNCMAIHINPSLPITNNLAGQNGVTTAGLRNYLWTIYGNARTSPYGPQDELLAEVSVGNMISTRTWLMRALCVPFCVDFRNRSYPDELLVAMGIDPDDMREHLAQYRIRFNTLTATANKIPFPADIQYFKKCAAMFADVYRDDDKSVLAQSYFFNPSTVWVLNETYDANGTGLDTTEFVKYGTTKNFSAYLDIWEQQINALLNSSTMNYVYADILRLAQKGHIKSLLFFDPLPEVAAFNPVYNTEIQLWVHNMQILGHPAAVPIVATHSKSNDVSSDASNNSVFYSPEWYVNEGGTYHVTPDGRLLDFYTDNPGVEDKVAATRLSATWNVVSPAVGGKFFYSDVCILDWYVTEVILWSSTTVKTRMTTNFGNWGDNPKAQAALTHFRWCPITYVTKSGSYDGNTRLTAIAGELNYYTIIKLDMLRRAYDYEIIELLSIGDAQM